MAITNDLLAMVDARINAARQRTTAAGTVVEVQGSTVLVAFDGSSFAVPVKHTAGLALAADDRVTLMRVGSDWVVVGAFNRSHRSRYGLGGELTVSFTSRPSYLLNVDFPVPFPDGVTPRVYVSIAGGPGEAIGWVSRGINTTSVDFDLYLHSADGGSDAWPATRVVWDAFAG